MNDILIFCGTGLFAVFAISVIRELRKEFTVPVILTVCIVFLLYVVPKIGESVQFIREISSCLEQSHASVLLRALGITYLTGTSCEICKSAGEPAVGGYIELAGKVLMMTAAAPVLTGLLEMVMGLV